MRASQAHKQEEAVLRGLVNTTEQFNSTMESQRVMVMALQTLPVKLRNGNREMTVNALLDDGKHKKLYQ